MDRKKTEQAELGSNTPSMTALSDLRLSLLHWMVIGLSLLLTVFAWYITRTQAEEKSRVKFSRESEQVISHILERMRSYEDALWAGAAYIAAIDNHFTATDWATYTQKLSIEKKYPGINGIGVIYAVPKNRLKEFEDEQRKERPFFKVYPSHSQSISLPITYIEPIELNKKALGLDVAHEKNRFNAAKNSEKSNSAQITAPIVLVQDNESTPGFLFYVPFYSDNQVQTALKHEENSFLGLVYAPFIFKKLMDGLLAEENRLVSLKIRDLGDALYDETLHHQLNEYTPKHSKSIYISLYGRNWTIDTHSTPQFNKVTENNNPMVILFTGLTIDSLLFFVFFTLGRSRKKAILYARRMTTELQRSANDLEKLAHIDFLTDLPNRMSFLAMLSKVLLQAESDASKVAVCFIDIDNFKKVNDNLGHDIGDKLLIALVARLKPVIRDSDYLSRYGGDEFGLIIENADNEDGLLLILNRCLEVAGQPVKINNYDIDSSISIGIAVYPYAGKTANELISHADIAMYRAKSQGKNSFEFFDNRMNEIVKRRHAIDSAMKHAVKNNELYLLYQPQVDINTNRPVGIEALLRWRSPDLGELMPEEFIPLAEENGLISEIGLWVLRQSFSDLANMQGNGQYKHIKLSINVSAKQLEQSDMAQQIQDCLVQYNISSNNIYLELTESALMKNIDRTKKTMLEISRLGLHFSLDDFGTGYSSLQYLKTLPISLLKLDKVFVRDIVSDFDDAIIVKATIQLAHSLGLNIVAEGVETIEQLDYLREHRCDQVQGFYYSVPLTRDDFISWLNNYGSTA